MLLLSIWESVKPLCIKYTTLPFNVRNAVCNLLTQTGLYRGSYIKYVGGGRRGLVES